MNQYVYFVAGVERSGTTMLRLMLDHHPSICCFGEFDYAIDGLRQYRSLPDLSEYIKWLSTHRTFQDQKWEMGSYTSIKEVLADVLNQAQRKSSKQTLGAAVHRKFPLLLRFWPEARFVHIVRDPRDVARSWISMGWAGSVLRGARGWMRVERDWMELVQQLPEDRTTVVRYEDLIANPEGELSRLCAFLDLEYNGQMLKYDRDTTYKRPDTRFASQWRKKLSAKEIRIVEAVCEHEMTRYGYAPVSPAPRELKHLTICKSWLRDKVSVARFRQKRYGWRLYLENAIARRVGLKQWSESARHRIDNIDRQYLK